MKSPDSQFHYTATVSSSRFICMTVTNASPVLSLLTIP